MTTPTQPSCTQAENLRRLAAIQAQLRDPQYVAEMKWAYLASCIEGAYVAACDILEHDGKGFVPAPGNDYSWTDLMAEAGYLTAVLHRALDSLLSPMWPSVRACYDAHFPRPQPGEDEDDGPEDDPVIIKTA